MPRTNIGAGVSDSEQALLDLWDYIDAVRLKQSEQHAAIIARRALEAATKETRLNARLKELAIRGGMPLAKVQALVDYTGGDEAWIESILAGATATEKAAMLSGTAYKADEDAAGDVPPEVDEALFAAFDIVGDWQPIINAVQALAAPVKARILTDSGKQSSLPTTAKTYSPARDAFAVAVGADQVRPGRAPVTTKQAPVTLKQLIEASLNSMGDLH